MDTLAGALASLGGVIVGGVLQHITSRRALSRQHEWERSRLVQEKLEQVTEVTKKLCANLESVYLNAIESVRVGAYIEREYVLPFAELEMLLGFYAPELKPHHDRLVLLRDEMSKVLIDIVSGRIPTAKEDKQALNDKFMSAVFTVSKICTALTDDAYKLGRKRLDIKEA